MSNAFELTVTKTIPAPAKTVFEAWLDPKALSAFMKPGPGMSDARVECDPTEGGNFLIAMKAGDKELEHRGEYKSIERYERLVFTWLSGFTVPDSTVTLSFKEVGPKQTELTLHHVGFPNEESRNNHEGGWAQIIDLAYKYVA